MKRILLLSLLLLPIVALAQYPTFSNKQKLGVQTTGDGLIFRGNLEVPNYIPSNVNNAYFYLDTVRNTLKFYKDYWIQIYPTPQFDTTTLNVYLKISDTTAMLLPYFRDSDTTSLNLINRFALKFNISDTATMLTPYMKKADTISLSNRIDLKLNISDTTILSNRITTNANNIITINNKLATKLDTVYVKFKNVVTMIENKDTINIGSSLTDGYAINIIGDSVNVDSVILDARYPDRDSTNELQSITFATTTGVITVPASKIMNLDTLYNSVIDSVNLLIRDSIAAFTPLTEGYGINIIGDSINVDTTVIFTQSDTITLSNRINTKLNASDTASLSNRIDLKLNISDTTNMLAPYLREADTTSLSNRINTKIDTIYVNYQTNVDVITNKDTININPQLTEGFGINIIADSINIDSAVILATQQKQIAYVKNQSGITIYKGQAVYSSGSSGSNKLVTLASSNTESSSSKTFGVVESDSIPNGSHGYIITFGLLSGINTDALNEGSSVYLSSTSGQLTSVKPIAPLHLVTIGVCIRKQQNNGSIFVKIQNGFEFDELHDVRITTPVDKSSVYYNLSENLWRDTTATLLVSDTASMLNPYLRKLDTITLSNRINTKLNISDTASMLTPYFRDADTTSLNLTSRFAAKLNLSDTASMLTNYLRSGVAASTYLTQSNAASTYLPLAGGTLTGVLNGTTGTFNTRLGVGSFAGSPLLFASGTGNQEVHFAHSQNIPGATVTLRLTNTNAGFFDQGAYFQGIVNRGINEMSGALGTNGSEYIRLRGVDDGGVVGVGIFNPDPSYNLDVTGTFRATSTSLIGGTLGVTGATTLTGGINGNTKFNNGNVSVNTNTSSNWTSSYAILEMGNSNTYNTIWGSSNGDGGANSWGQNGIGNNIDFNKYYGNGAASYLIQSGGRLSYWTSPNGAAGAIRTDSKRLEIDANTLTTYNASVFNEGSADADFRVESDGNANMVFVDASTDRVGIGYASPTKTLDVNGTLGVFGATTLSNTLTVDGKTILNDSARFEGNILFKKNMGLPIVKISNADYTATTDNHTIIYTTLTADKTLTIPNASDAVGVKFVISIFDIPEGNEALTLVTPGSNLFVRTDGENSSVDIVGGYCTTIQSDGIKWYILSYAPMY